jgi:hypothetical protein
MNLKNVQIMRYRPKIDSYWLKTDTEFNAPIEIVVDRFYYTPVPEGTIRIVIIQEPYSYDLINIVLDKRNDNFYTYVFTYHQQVLDNCKKAIQFICVHTWIRNYQFPQKKFGVSTLVGGKTKPTMEGLDYRHNLWHRQNEIKIPKDFYLSSAYPYAGADYRNSLVLNTKLEDKQIMFNSEYHIVIENTAIRNMFTEKILDCFQTKTIPIFYGCSNIGDFFNADGILMAKNVDDIINICNSLTPEIYNTKLVAIEDNYQRSMEYITAAQVLDNKLNEILNK